MTGEQLYAKTGRALNKLARQKTYGVLDKKGRMDHYTMPADSGHHNDKAPPWGELPRAVRDYWNSAARQKQGYASA